MRWSNASMPLSHSMAQRRAGEFKSSIRKDDAEKHLDKLHIDGGSARFRGAVPQEGRRRRPHQTFLIGKWQFLGGKSPCVRNRAAPSATVKMPRSSACEIRRVNATADGSVFTRVRRTSFAGFGERMRRQHHDRPLRESRMPAALRTDPAQLVLRAVLLDEVPRDLQAAAGAQQGLLEVALSPPRTGGSSKKLI